SWLTRRLETAVDVTGQRVRGSDRSGALAAGQWSLRERHHKLHWDDACQDACAAAANQCDYVQATLAIGPESSTGHHQLLRVRRSTQSGPRHDRVANAGSRRERVVHRSHDPAAVQIRTLTRGASAELGDVVRKRHTGELFREDFAITRV